MAASKALIVNALESRYDYYSARNVFKDALRVAGLEEKNEYSSADVAALVQSLAEIGDRVESVLARLQPHAEVTSTKKQAAKPEKKAVAAEEPTKAAAGTSAGGSKPAPVAKPAEKPKPAKKTEAKKKTAKKKAVKKKAVKKK